MSDDQIQEGLHAYAERVQHTATVPAASAVRRRAEQRRRRRVTGAAFAVVLVAAAGIGLTVKPDSPAPLPAASSTPSSRPPASYPEPLADLSPLTRIGIDVNTNVLIDVADDGVDRWMQAGPDGVVDFGGTARTEATTMFLRPAAIRLKSRVLITPPAFPGRCVADTPDASLVLQPCVSGDRSQMWRVVPAGDSGQFELEGRYGILRVDEGLLTSGGTGRTGLQTIKF
ncbi:MAG: hypothetical protein ABW046_23360 [Actinoplanes sp.]